MFRKKDSTPSGQSAGTGLASGRSAAPAGPPPAQAAAMVRAQPPQAAPGSGPAQAASGAKPTRAAGKGKQIYEARRAEKAGMGLEKWMAEKDRRVQAERTAVQRAHQKALPKKPGLLRRLLDKAHRPI